MGDSSAIGSGGDRAAAGSTMHDRTPCGFSVFVLCVCILGVTFGSSDALVTSPQRLQTKKSLRRASLFQTGDEQLSRVIEHNSKSTKTTAQTTTLMHAVVEQLSVDPDFDAVKCNTDCTKAISMCMELNPQGLAKSYKADRHWCDMNARGGVGLACCHKYVALHVGGCTKCLKSLAAVPQTD